MNKHSAPARCRALGKPPAFAGARYQQAAPRHSSSGTSKPHPSTGAGQRANLAQEATTMCKTHQPQSYKGSSHQQATN